MSPSPRPQLNRSAAARVGRRWRSIGQRALCWRSGRRRGTTGGLVAAHDPAGLAPGEYGGGRPPSPPLTARRHLRRAAGAGAGLSQLPLSPSDGAVDSAPLPLSQASSSACRTRRSSAARNALVPRALAVDAAGNEPTGVDLEAPIDDDTGLPLIICPFCKDVRVFAATTTYSDANHGRRYFKCPRKNYRHGRCFGYWFEEEYVVYLQDNGYLVPACSTIAAGSTSEVRELVGKIDSLEQNLNKVKEMVGKNREGIGSCICLVCGCVNVTILLVFAIFMVVAYLLK